jgi:hypothetical protein
MYPRELQFFGDRNADNCALQLLFKIGNPRYSSIIQISLIGSENLTWLSCAPSGLQKTAKFQVDLLILVVVQFDAKTADSQCLITTF